MKSTVSSINDLVFLTRNHNYTTHEIVAIALSHVLFCKNNSTWKKLEFDLEQPLQNQFKLDGSLFKSTQNQYSFQKNYSFISLEDIYAQCESFEIPLLFGKIVEFLDYIKTDQKFNNFNNVQKLILGQDLNESPCIITLGFNYVPPEQDTEGNIIPENLSPKRTIH